MATKVHTARGEEVMVLDQGDLDRLKNMLIRWLLFTAIPAIVVATIWVTSIRKETDGLTTAVADMTVNGSRPVQSLKTDMMVTRAEMKALSDQIADLKEALRDEKHQ